MRKAVSLFLGFILVLTLFAGCSGSGSVKEGTNAAGSSSQATEAKTTAAPAAEPVTLTMMVQNHPARPLKDDWLVWKLHEKNVNVKLEVSGYQGDWWDAIPLVIASGQMPDLMWMVGEDSLKYGQQGALVNLYDHMDSLPNLKSWMEKNPGLELPMVSPEGKLYLHPSQGAFGDYDGLFLYRKDIFEKNNISLPKNYDEFYDTLMKLKEIYPDSTPLMAEDLFSFTFLGYSFGADCNIGYNTVSKKVIYGPAEDNFKQLLEFTAKAYKSKLIPQGYGSVSPEKKDELISTGKTFIIYSYITSMDNYNTTNRKTNPDYTWAFFPPPAGAVGAYNAPKLILQEGLTVTSTSKHQKEALRYIDYLFTEEARNAVSWGEEGTTYKTVDGKKEFLPSIKDSRQLSVDYGMMTSGNTAWYDFDANLALMSEETKNAYMEGLKYEALPAVLPALTKEENDSISIKLQALGKYATENVTKFVLGAKPLSEWDSYKDGLKKLGLDDVLKVYNDAEARRQEQQKN